MTTPVHAGLDAIAVGDPFETLFDQALVGLALADLSTRYVRVNSAYAELLGRPCEDLVGIPFAELTHPEDVAEERERVERLISGDERELRAEKRYVRSDGSLVWVLHGVRVVYSVDGRPAWFAVSAQDITDRRRAETELRGLSLGLARQAMRDSLTDLPNRALVRDRLRQALSRSQRENHRTGLVFLDLDDFKNINDEHGHAAGDDVLREVARRLTSVLRPADTVARLGGDEFVVIVDPVHDGAELEGVARRISEVLEPPVMLEDATPVDAAVSMGWCLSRKGERQPDGLLRRADAAMYAAKRLRTRAGRS